MIQVDIPLRGTIELHHAVFDINGTLALDGEALPAAVDRLAKLTPLLSLHALTANTYGNAETLEHLLGFPVHLVTSGEDKRRYVEQLGPARVIAFGNGRNDLSMLRIAAIGVAILGTEGLAMDAFQAADIVVSNPIDALDLLLHPKRLVATLRP
jgi:soluble P-type ATPase